jgi:hypothetical protein
VDGDSKTSRGFYSAGVHVGSKLVNELSFAHIDGLPSSWGGTFEGSVRQAHCIPNYFTKLIGSPPPPVEGALDGSNSAVYSTPARANNWHLNDAPVTIQAGKIITVFVNGPVYIDKNITYESSDVLHVPKFALVAKGSIYIGPNVTQLDGLYIAQPDPDYLGDPVPNDTGNIWTCHNNDQTTPSSDYLISNCQTQLVINGALTAKQVNFTRLKGNIGDADIAEDAGCANAVKKGAPDSSCANIAEIINYTPAMVMGGRFFSPPSDSLKLNVQSLISLPPAL